MTHHTNTTEALALIARADQHAGPCARCTVRPAVVLEYLCAECDAAEGAPSTVTWEPPAVAPAACRGCGEAPAEVEGLCGACYSDAAAVFDAGRARWFPGG